MQRNTSAEYTSPLLDLCGFRQTKRSSLKRLSNDSLYERRFETVNGLKNAGYAIVNRNSAEPYRQINPRVKKLKRTIKEYVSTRRQ